MRPGLLSRLRIHHWTILNELTVRYDQINPTLKKQIYNTHSDYYSLAIKFNILGISKFRFFFRLVLLEEAKGIYTWQIINKVRLYHVSFVLCKWR